MMMLKVVRILMEGASSYYVDVVFEMAFLLVHNHKHKIQIHNTQQ